MKHSTIFWIFWLTFVSIHHNQLQCTSAVVVKQQQLHKTAAIPTSALIKRRQHQQQPKQQQWFPKGTTKEVIGDVVDLPHDIDVPKENHEKNVEKNNLAKAFNVKQKKNAIKTLQQAADKAKTATTSTTSTSTTSPTTATSTKLFMQQLLKQHEETLQKLNDTGGSQAGGLTVVVEDDDDSFEIHSAEMKTLPNMPITKQYKGRSDNNTKDSLLFGFKENLKNLLKSNISQIKLQPELNEEYVSTATSSTIKRAAIMMRPQSTTTAAMTPTTPASSLPATSDAAAAPPTHTTNRPYNMFYAHSTPVERRHIIPEKLQYTRELYIKQGRLMGIKRNFQPSSGLRAVDRSISWFTLCRGSCG